MSDKPIPNIWPNVYANMLPRVREVARSLGYAIGVHGSMVNDCDLIAVPWVDDAAPADLLADAIGNALEGWTANRCPGTKPHGRLVWSFSLDPTHYIDLSVFSVIEKRAPASKPMCAACLGTGHLEGYGTCPNCKGSGDEKEATKQ